MHNLAKQQRATLVIPTMPTTALSGGNGQRGIASRPSSTHGKIITKSGGALAGDSSAVAKRSFLQSLNTSKPLSVSVMGNKITIPPENVKLLVDKLSFLPPSVFSKNYNIKSLHKFLLQRYGRNASVTTKQPLIASTSSQYDVNTNLKHKLNQTEMELLDRKKFKGESKRATRSPRYDRNASVRTKQPLIALTSRYDVNTKLKRKLNQTEMDIPYRKKFKGEPKRATMSPRRGLHRASALRSQKAARGMRSREQQQPAQQSAINLQAKTTRSKLSKSKAASSRMQAGEHGIQKGLRLKRKRSAASRIQTGGMHALVKKDLIKLGLAENNQEAQFTIKKLLTNSSKHDWRIGVAELIFRDKHENNTAILPSTLALLRGNKKFLKIHERPVSSHDSAEREQKQNVIGEPPKSSALQESAKRKEEEEKKRLNIENSLRNNIENSLRNKAVNESAKRKEEEKKRLNIENSLRNKARKENANLEKAEKDKQVRARLRILQRQFERHDTQNIPPIGRQLREKMQAAVREEERQKAAKKAAEEAAEKAAVMLQESQRRKLARRDAAKQQAAAAVTLQATQRRKMARRDAALARRDAAKQAAAAVVLQRGMRNAPRVQTRRFRNRLKNQVLERREPIFKRIFNAALEMKKRGLNETRKQDLNYKIQLWRNLIKKKDVEVISQLLENNKFMKQYEATVPRIETIAKTVATAGVAAGSALAHTSSTLFRLFKKNQKLTNPNPNHYKRESDYNGYSQIPSPTRSPTRSPPRGSSLKQ